ncbi:hypothetical protein [Anabaenopsis elenkinii]|uniref:Uncharacterized protein n=1 Tax=Anabaenopsis elenkinii CCIBt3563 TaxID=2779889 RepID=A0A7S6RFT7_9CYAN|nr:hypothetical protein [Anabaenopsis elenkinii]QOV23990.1 hypothetical protein IM676_06885 [Anabaenopsis elenkinii CCIBt3563]
MQTDLQDLEISRTELNNLTGLDINTVPKLSVVQDPIKMLSFVFIKQQEGKQGLYILFAISAWMSILFIFKEYKGFFDYIIGGFALLVSVTTGVPTYETLQKYMQLSGKDSPMLLLCKLLEEVDRHNQIIKNIDTLDQLKSVGNAIDLSNREKVIEAIKITRKDLLLAIKTDKILRENPGFNPESFAVDLTGLQALQVSATASEYSQILDQALQIGVNVQEEMRQLS